MLTSSKLERFEWRAEFRHCEPVALRAAGLLPTGGLLWRAGAQCHLCVALAKIVPEAQRTLGECHRCKETTWVRAMRRPREMYPTALAYAGGLWGRFSNDELVCISCTARVRSYDCPQCCAQRRLLRSMVVVLAAGSAKRVPTDLLLCILEHLFNQTY